MTFYKTTWAGMCDAEIAAENPQAAAIERMRCVYVEKLDSPHQGAEAHIAVSDGATTNVFRVALSWVSDGAGKWVATYSAVLTG